MLSHHILRAAPKLFGRSGGFASVLPHLRAYSAGGDSLVLCNVDEKGVATVKLNRPPVNSLSLELLTDLSITLDKLENEKKCQGIILTSGKDGVFCAGLDIMEMYQPQEARLREFWKTLQEVWMKLYGARHATVAAINGHSPAGGCLLSLCCDHRIMANGKFSIGLNETKLGIVAPFWFVDSMVNTVGRRATERALQLGEMYSSDQALRMGMVDKLVDMGEVQAEAQQEIKQWIKIPGAARVLSKMAMRAPTVQKLQMKQQEDINNFVNFAMKDSVQKSLGMYLDALKNKSSKK